MNTKKISDFKIGDSAELKHLFSENDVNIFANISMDKNPIHLDEKYAETTKFGKKIVHGFLSGSLISAVLGNLLPGNGSIYMCQNMNFIRPVFIGDEITAKVIISSINIEKKQILLDTFCTNQFDKNVIEGNAIMYYPY